VSKGKIYDEEIAPLVERIIGMCKEHDIAFDAFFELDDALTVQTSIPSYKESAGQRLRFYLGKSGNNLDAFILAIIQDKKLVAGHSSAMLKMLGFK
jgi:hypothetical protein